MTRAVDNLGPHLLRRLESPYDSRDYRLSDYLAPDPLDALLAAVTKKHYSGALKDLLTAMVQRIEGAAPPGPTPAPTTNGWLDTGQPVLDQGQTGHCVGFTGADWKNALPVDDHVQNAEGDRLYYLCKIKDGEPKQEDGSTIRSLAQVLQDAGRLKTYAFASTIDEVWQFVQTSGPICWGIGWTNSMFTPDSTGLVVPTGADVGGHAIIQYAVDGDYGLLLNHWGTSWGVGGKFRMHKSDLAERLSNGGEAMAAVELP